MTSEEKEKLRVELHKQIAATTTKVEKLEADTAPIGPENAIGRVSRMDAINNKSVIEAALRQAKKKLYRMQEALKAIDKEKFGICINCGQAIPMGRLMLMPESAKCVRCS